MSSYILYSKWASPNLTYSFVPDGTDAMGFPSVMFALYASLPGWQDAIRAAMKQWSDASGLTFTEHTDNGAPLGAPGLFQGDPNFGDIRIAASAAITGMGHATFPGGSTLGGDIVLNGSGVDAMKMAAMTWINKSGHVTEKGKAIARIMTLSPLEILGEVFLHECGAAIGFEEGQPFNSVLNLLQPTLTPGDLAAVADVYGPNPNPPPAPPPLTITATPLGSGKMKLDWVKTVASGGYIIERRLGNTSLPWNRIATVSMPPFIDTGLVNGRLYDYHVLALTAGPKTTVMAQ